jgi:phosphatidate cytidylyltransferase
MKTRAITGFFFVIVMLASMLTGEYTFTLFFSVLSLFCLNEFYGLVNNENLKPQRLSGTLLALSLLLWQGFYFLKGTEFGYILITVPVGIFVFFVELYRSNKNPFQNISYTFLGIIFAVLPFSFFHAIAFIDGTYNFHYPLGFFLMLWANDTGAYLVGIKFGKIRLFERHSPKKSWEGFAGGVVTSLLVGLILANYFTELALVHWAVISLIISVVGTYGDLTESMLKRSLDKKDSGSLLPGHGGLLDRFDGLLLSAPLVLVYLYFIFSY